MRIFKRSIEIIRKNGYKCFLSVVLLRLMEKVGLPSEIQIAKEIVSNILIRKFSNTVAYGPLEGVKLADSVWWGKHDVSCKLLGQYELHVMQKLIDCKTHSDLFIDIGAADGYFAIGLVRSNSYRSSICYELSKKGQDVIHETANLNGILDRITVRGIATEESICEAIEENAKAVILCDIEGAEFEVLTERFLEIAKDCIFVIELHDTLSAGLGNRRQELFRRAGKYFDISYLERSSPPVNSFVELDDISDNLRFLAFSEGRPLKMEWICMTPKHR